MFVLPILLLLLVPTLGLAFVALVAMRLAPRRVMRPPPQGLTPGSSVREVTRLAARTAILQPHAP